MSTHRRRIHMTSRGEAVHPQEILADIIEAALRGVPLSQVREMVRRAASYATDHRFRERMKELGYGSALHD